MAKLYPGHYLMGCRLDNWLRLLGENRFRVERDKIPEALLITAASAAFYPAALAEEALLRRKLSRTVLAQRHHLSAESADQGSPVCLGGSGEYHHDAGELSAGAAAGTRCAEVPQGRAAHG